jgi:HPt (histidine-containing phosphotransfer) domain-containing protein
LLVDPELVAEIRRLERATGRNDIFAGFVRKLEGDIQAFGATFSGHVARGEAAAAVRAAHTLKGTCRQLGAMDLGDLFAEIESIAKAGDYAQAQSKYDTGATLIAQSLEALKRA